MINAIVELEISNDFVYDSSKFAVPIILIRWALNESSHKQMEWWDIFRFK